MSTTAPTIPLGTNIKNMRMIIQTNANYQNAYLIPGTGNGNFVLKQLDDFFENFVVGAFNCNIQIMASGVYATGTATFASVVATNTLVIGGVTITAVSSAPTSVQFLVGANDTATAANAVKTINALTTMNKVVQASSTGAVVTIACLVPGTIGNLVTLSAGGGTITVGAALTGGTDGAQGTISHGL